VHFAFQTQKGEDCAADRHLQMARVRTLSWWIASSRTLPTEASPHAWGYYGKRYLKTKHLVIYESFDLRSKNMKMFQSLLYSLEEGSEKR
jgi:hypothetical protein